uniref:glutathione transferase n=1 Tax=Rhinolophus ferrumequinum TaxID=59479 RepID=A0A671FG06_RHIFE
MVLELYLDLISQPSRAVYIFAKKNGIPFELGNVELLKGQHLTKEFFPVNSLQRVPTLKDGDFVLSERCSPSLPPLHTAAHMALALPQGALPHPSAPGPHWGMRAVGDKSPDPGS